MKKFSILFAMLMLSSAFGEVVDVIEFEGLDRIEKSVLEDSVIVKPGVNYSNIDIDNTIKKLFSKGFFSDIKVIKKGNRLIIKCTERPMVDRVAFEGNDAASDQALTSVIHNRIESGKLIDTYMIKDILSDFQTLYRNLGYCSATVVPKIVKRPGNKIDVVFEISEGEKTTIKKIILVGNKQFSDENLKDLMELKEERKWRFWSFDSHILREDKLESDIEHITTLYKNNGYPFFMVTSTSIEMSFDKKSHYCTIIMEEGDKYTIGDVEVSSEVEQVKAEKLKDYIPIRKGVIYSEGFINFAKDWLRNTVAINGHPFIDVVVDVSFDKKNKTASLKYKIIEKEKAFVERIEIYGNNKTLDKVIRREMLIHEGDTLSEYKVRNSVERIRNCGYLDDVEIAEEEGSSEDRKVLKISVKEAETTTQVRFGANVSTVDGIGGMVQFVEQNLFGSGRRFSVDTSWMQKYYGCNIDLYDPRFMDQNFGAGIRTGGGKYNRKRANGSMTKNLFISPYVRYSITPNLFHSISFFLALYKKTFWDRINKRWFSDIPASLNNSAIREEYGNYTTGEVSSSLVYQKTDNSYVPRNGYELSMVNSVAGLFGNVRYLKNEFGARYYRPLTSKVTFIADFNFGFIFEGHGTRSGNRFSFGGDGQSMRGFDVDGVGPHLGYNSIGGNKFWTASFEAKTPLSSREVGINGVVFLDMGSAWGTKYKHANIKDSSAIRASVGFGIEWERSPLGVPMAFVFGFPIKKKSFDEKRTFTLSGFM